MNAVDVGTTRVVGYAAQVSVESMRYGSAV